MADKTSVGYGLMEVQISICVLKLLGKHWVNVVDDYGCEASDTIMVNAYSGVVDALVDIKLEYVSVDTATQENINVAWTVIHPEKIPDNSVFCL